MVGTPLYMSPQILKSEKYTTKSKNIHFLRFLILGDIWSLGIIFYQIICGQLPWNAK